MIDSISISNFKAIGETPLELKNLTQVNYLVGKNGSGKSSVLEAIMTKSVDSMKEQTQKNYHEFEVCLKKLSIDDFDYLQNYKKDNCEIDLQGYFFNSLLFVSKNLYFDSSNIFKLMSENYFNTILQTRKEYLEKFNKIIEELGLTEVKFLEDNRLDMDPESCLSTGEKAIIELLLISFKMDCSSSRIPSIIIIEEPENNLHPSFQKLIPEILQEISKEFNVQFFVATHSPFIISAAAGLENQKAYLLENGKCLNSFGSSGQRVVFESAKMLGAGIGDIHPAPKFGKQQQNKSHIVYCEGKDTATNVSDAEIYNQIFRNHINVLFISCNSCEDVYYQFLAGKEFYKYQQGCVEILGLIDSDSQNSKKEEWKNLGIKILKRREIENYLYDKEIVAKLENLNQILEKINKIENLNEHDFKANSKINQALKSKHLDLAKLITPDTDIYIELYQVIFGLSETVATENEIIR